jgi:TRAP-type C4-dicarboxylate transport system substrate-binding protein
MKGTWGKILLVMVAFGLVFSTGGISTAKQLVLVVASHVPPKYADIYPLTKVFVDEINKAGEGKIKLEYHPSGTLLKVNGLIPGLISGVADMIFLTSSECTGSWPFIGGESLPFLFKSADDLEQRIKIGSPLFNLINEVLEKKHGIMMLANGTLPLERLWTRTPVKTPADLKGLSIRVGGRAEGEAIKALGGNPVTLTSAELYEALQRGTIDGVVCYPGTIYGRSLQEVLKFNTNIPIGAYGYAIWVKKSTWNSWPEDIRKIVQKAAKKYDEGFLVNATKVEKEQYWPAFEKAGIQTITPSPEAMSEFKNKVKPVWDKWAKEVGESQGQKLIKLSTE